MPELAEVAYFCRRWDPGLGHRIVGVDWHPRVRIFRGIDPDAFTTTLTGARLVRSATRGKQMLFLLDRASLGIHLGMTGKLFAAPPGYSPGAHDHLVLHQGKTSLVFSDFRLFGRVVFQKGPREPAWWRGLPTAVTAPEWSRDNLAEFLERRSRSPLKAVLLLQEHFPGIGNWMADEILWRAGFLPQRRPASLSSRDVNILWKETRHVAREALRIIGKDFSDPPDSWLFPHRWAPGGACPRCGLDLDRGPVGGRTSCWCNRCQS